MCREKTYHASGDLMLRRIAGEDLLIPVGEAAGRVHGLICLSESGSLLWQEMERGATEEALVERILSEYDVDRETAAGDVRAFLEKLDKIGVLVP